MTQSTKVFVYNAQGSGPNSTADLANLFASPSIFGAKPDVVVCDFKFNTDQLRRPTFVVPGGSTTIIGQALKPQIDKIKNDLKQDFNYVGICAGAFLAADDANLFYTTHASNSEKFAAVGNTKKFSFGITPDIKASGAFYPNKSFSDCKSPKALMPYLVTISLSDTKKLSQLYVGGPTFFSSESPDAKAQSEIVATYDDSDSFVMDENEQKSFKSKTLPAMFRRKATQTCGGVFISATHVESCVPSSKLLTFFQSSSDKNAALNPDDHKKLASEQASTQAIVESMLKDTLGFY